MAREQFVEHAAKGEDVAPRVHVLGFDLVRVPCIAACRRRYVHLPGPPLSPARSMAPTAMPGSAALAGAELREAEVEHFHARGVIMMLAGFRSRWTMPFPCAAQGPQKSRGRREPPVDGHRSLDRFAVDVLHHQIACRGPTSTACMFGWFSGDARASRSKRSVKGPLMVFTATCAFEADVAGAKDVSPCHQRPRFRGFGPGRNTNAGSRGHVE